MNWLHYLLEANIYLGVFYIAYCLFLNNETHYVLNRVYLISSCIIAFVLPVLQLGMLLPPPPPPPMAPVEFTPIQITNIPATIIPVVEQHQFNWQDGLWYVYLAGAVIFLILFIIKLLSLAKLVIGKPVLKHNDYNLIYINEANTAFSFFNYLFIGKNAPDKNIITRHELVHIRQMHSADIVFLEALKIISWFNPLIYLIQGSLKTVHEYIADEQSVDSKDDALTYSSFLVNNAYGLTGPSITHSFFTYNLLKRRIIMLNQQRSGNLARLKYLVAVPIGAALLCASTLGFSKTYGWIDLAPRNMDELNAKSASIKETTVKANDKAPYEDFYEHVRNTLHFPASLKNKNFGITLIASFDLDKNGFIKNVSTNNSKSHPEISNDIVTAVESYKKPIDDKFGGKRFMVINFGSKNGPPPPPLDNKIGGDPGYLGTYLITDAPSAKLEITNYPPPRVVPDMQVPPKPKADQVKFPYPVRPDKNSGRLTPISQRNFIAFAGLRAFLTKTIRYPDVAREKKISGVIIAKFDIDDNGSVTNPSIERSDLNEFNEAALAGLNTFTGKISSKTGSYYMNVAFIANGDQVKFPPPIPNNFNFVGDVFITTGTKAKYDYVRFPASEPELKVAAGRVYNSKTRKWTTLQPPPPPAPITALVPAGFKPQKTYINGNGYKIKEGGGGNKNGRTWYLAIISDPAGKDLNLGTDIKQRKFVLYKGMVEAEKTALALFGYKFPDVKVSPLPPEPPKPKVDHIKFPPPVVMPDSITWRNNKATPPKPKNDQVKFPPPVVRKGKRGYISKTGKWIPIPPIFAEKYFVAFADLRSYLMKTIRYPKETKEQNITKHVTATFNIDVDGRIKDARISYNSSKYFDEAILKAINAYTEKIAVNADTYSMVFQFNIYKKNGPKKFPPPVAFAPGLVGLIYIAATAE